MKHRSFLLIFFLFASGALLFFFGNALRTDETRSLKMDSCASDKTDESCASSSSSSDSTIVKYNDPYKDVNLETIAYFLLSAIGAVVIGGVLLCWMISALKLLKEKEEDDEEDLSAFASNGGTLKNYAI